MRKDVRRNLERVLQAAHQLFAERGTDVTMEEVARHAGVGVGTVYRRFPSKEHLFFAVSQAACADTHRCLQEAAESQPDPVGKLRALVHVHYRHSDQQAALIDLQPSPVGQQCAADGEQHFYVTLHTLLEHVIAEGQRTGTMAEGDSLMLAALCLELINPRALQNLRRVTGGTSDEIAAHVVRFILNGLATR
jgi:AcrR family transcriptional regulator